MSTQLANSTEVNLGATLHDGQLESLAFDEMARSLTFVIDVPFLRSFHKLQDATRFHVVLNGITELQVVQFVAWPGAITPEESLPYAEKERIRQEMYAMGHFESASWNELSTRLSSSDDYEILSATALTSDESVRLDLVLMNNVEYIYPELRIFAKNIKFLLTPENEISIDRFVALGKAYWDAFSQRHSPEI